MINLHVAKQTIKYHPEVAMSGYEAPETLYDILRIYDCGMGPVGSEEMDCYTMMYEVDRDDLIRTRNSIAAKDGFFHEHEAEIRNALKRSECSPMDIVGTLDQCINNSDHSDSWVLLSWF